MVFPTEHALLEAFVVTYDVMGLDVGGEVNPFFVEWVTGPPPPNDGEPAVRVHERLRDLSARWRVDHPCWVPDVMPALRPEASDWPMHATQALLGTSGVS